MILITPARSNGMRDKVPFLSSILSIIKIATIEVNATVICKVREYKKTSTQKKFELITACT